MNMGKGQFIGKEKVTFVGKIIIESLSAKAKFGQNLKSEDFEQIMLDLEHRGSTIDIETIKLMKQFLT